MSEIELETEFEKINLEEGACKSKEDVGGSKCDCRKSLEHYKLMDAGSSLKVKDKRRNLIKPSRLKVIGICYARKSRKSSEEAAADDPAEDVDTFTSEAFLRMRIAPPEALTHSARSPAEEKDEKTSPASHPNSCSAQAKLQQQFSSSEFDSTIDEMSEILAYHLKLVHPQDKNYLVDSMYT